MGRLPYQLVIAGFFSSTVPPEIRPHFSMVVSTIGLGGEFQTMAAMALGLKPTKPFDGIFLMWPKILIEMATFKIFSRSNLNIQCNNSST